MAGPDYTTADLIDAQEHLPNLSIGPYTFFCNPWDFHVTEQRIQTTVPTRAGVGRFSYGVQARQYQITGYTSNAGIHAIDGMGAFRPTFGKAHKDRPYFLTFAFFNITRATVYIDQFDYYVEQDMENYIKYQIQASEYPPAEPPFSAQSVPSTYGMRAGPSGPTRGAS